MTVIVCGVSTMGCVNLGDETTSALQSLSSGGLHLDGRQRGFAARLRRGGGGRRGGLGQDGARQREGGRGEGHASNDGAVGGRPRACGSGCSSWICSERGLRTVWLASCGLVRRDPCWRCWRVRSESRSIANANDSHYVSQQCSDGQQRIVRALPQVVRPSRHTRAAADGVCSRPFPLPRGSPMATAAPAKTSAFMKALKPSPALAAIVGAEPLPRTAVTKAPVGLHQGPQPAEPGQQAQHPVRRQAQGRDGQGRSHDVRDDRPGRQAPELIRPRRVARAPARDASPVNARAPSPRPAA